MADDKKSKKPDSGIPIPPAPSARIDLPAPAPPGGQEAPAGQESVDGGRYFLKRTIYLEENF